MPVKRSWQYAEDEDGSQRDREEAILSRYSPSAGKKARYDEDVDFDSDADRTLVSQQLTVLSSEPERDATYYLPDGSCVLLVENTLFNVCLFHSR